MCRFVSLANRIDDDIAPGDHFLDRDNLIKGVELEGHYLAKVARKLEVQHLHLWAHGVTICVLIRPSSLT